MKKNTLIVATLSAFSFLAPSAHGAGLVVIQTDANGNFVPTNVGTGSWSGDGTVTSGITGSENEVTFVSGTSGGTFSPGNFAKRAGDPAVYINGDRDNTGISLNISQVSREIMQVLTLEGLLDSLTLKAGVISALVTCRMWSLSASTTPSASQ